MKVLEIRNVTKVLGGKPRVDRLSLDVFEGEILAFIGTNGAGKTTTMRMVLGLASATDGDVII
ncbi:MAG: ATP-binding cassette domain-containing protein, partial [Firmicutes bacterium]|nr:ATP-binding cassette domain-containing protein [Bacillota bacterium]